MENKIDFLNTAISDAQELIKFIDTKTAVIITILGAFLVSFFASLDKIIENSSDYSNWFWFFIILFFVLITLCIIVTARIIKPINNPLENVNFGNSSKPTLKFCLTPNDYSKGSFPSLTNSNKFKLTENFETYSQTLNSAVDTDIINSLTLELFKVSYIRNIKNDRLNTLLCLLLITTISFFISYLFFSIETNNTIEKLAQIHKTCCEN
jgi:hypothetical protein